MKKRYFFAIVIYIFVFLFFGCKKNVFATDIFIESLPTCEDIEYGEPLFESAILGGLTNVDGVFKWKDPELILDVGVHSVEVIFDPDEETHPELTVKVNINVNKKRVYIKFEDDIYKQYDDSREIVLPNYIVLGISSHDDVYVSGKLKGILESGLVSDSTNVMLEGIELKGERKDNYYLDLSGFKARVYPRKIEKLFGDKNKIEFSSNIYVPIDSMINVEKLDDINLVKDGYEIKEIYDIYLISNLNRVDVNGKVKVKAKVDEKSFLYKRLEIFNYYNGEYQKIVDYKYEDGYFIYEASGLGQLIFTQRKLNYTWVYYLILLLVLSCISFVVIKLVKKRKRINKYKSLKRRKDNGDC